MNDQSSLFINISDIKKNFKDRLYRGEEFDCPCCGRYSKIYKRTLHKGIALSLMRLYRATRGDSYLHISKFCTIGSGVDIPLARFWGLVEAMPNEDSKKRTSGIWKLTPVGVAFIKNQHRIKKYILLFDNHLLGFDGDDCDITEALGKEFNYQELMAL